jgi:tRNA threonylcarbamoyladenosine biosynthesis protein TsaE
MRLDVDLPDPAATARLAGALARRARIGDVVALSGDLGVGKTSFARAFIAMRGCVEEVPSPTFALVQTYDLANGPIWHFDLYRLARPEDAVELGIDDAFAEGITLIEWPDRLGAGLPARRLAIALEFGTTPDARRARLDPGGDWPTRLADLDV